MSFSMGTPSTAKERLLRPQPIGILPIPAGLLLLPDALETSQALKALLRGDASVPLPEAWEFYASARGNRIPEALRLLSKATGEIGAYNRFVLEPSPAAYKALRLSFNGPMSDMLEVAAFTSGLSDDPPSGSLLDGEMLAVARMTQAAAYLEHNDNSAAVVRLREAIDAARGPSPLFAAHLLAQLAEVNRAGPGPMTIQTVELYRDAIRLAEPCAMPEFTADLQMQLGICCQELSGARPDLLNNAVSAYQQVLRSGLVPEEHAELFALAHNNLGLTFLSMPMSDGGKQLRLGIAVQSFREGQRLVERDSPMWSTMQLNLANALQYLPSTHPEENLAQAVELYEELLTIGRKAYDPLGYAKILSNQANALAHLGIFSPALEKLQEARKLFEWHNETDLAAASMDLVAEIHGKIGNREPAAAGKD